MTDTWQNLQTPRIDTVAEDLVRKEKYKSSKKPTYRPQYRFGDPFANPSNNSSLLFGNPPLMKPSLEIDTALNYTIHEKIGGVDYRPPSRMTFKEFDRYQENRMKAAYWKDKSSGLDGENAVSSRKRLIPKLYISPVFDRIFGGNYIDIQPSGMVNLDFGGRWQRIENPNIPVSQQSNGGFIYNQQISMNVVGKVGKKLQLKAIFDNNNSFDFQNNMKVQYSGFVEDIIKKIEVGNVGMSVSNSLMSGGQSLFGVKAELQFGKLFVTALASRKQGRRNTKTFQYGAEGQKFSLRATDYDDRRHFFLGHFFRDNYEKWLTNLPQVTSGVNITRVEAYVLNTNNTTTGLRNIVAFMDLGERSKLNLPQWKDAAATQAAYNEANKLWNTIRNNPRIRQVGNVDAFLKGLGLKTEVDYLVRPSARRLNSAEYTWNPKLGYMTLQRKLQNSEILAVAYEYTYNGATYVVGELTETYSGFPDDNLIILKMLRPAKINTQVNTWNLEMKNIYAVNASGATAQTFTMRIKYRDDTKNYNAPNLNEGARTNNIPLVELFGADRLNVNGDNQKDGKFDFIKGVTFDVKKGNVIFPVLEPFGKTLNSKFGENEQALKDKYVFNDLYRKSKIDAAQNQAKNKFFLYGTYSSSATGAFPLNAFNLAKGSVRVTAGGQLLTEGKDFTVSYSGGGSVKVNPSIVSAGNKINISYETTDVFSFASRWLTGTRLEYRFSDKVNVGATLFHLNERPNGRSRFNAGEEPTNNVKYGLDFNFRDDSRILTKAIDALPLLSTKEKSTVTFSGEFAQLLPGTSNKVNGESTSYLDDFESAAIAYSMKGGNRRWKLSTPPKSLIDVSDPLKVSYRRAKMAWYTVDPSVFYTNTNRRPSNIPANIPNHYERRVLPQEIFRQQDRQIVNNAFPLFDIAFYPSERGPYNYNPDLDPNGLLKSPKNSYAAIATALTRDNNFKQTNVEYIEFWMLDPFIEGANGVVNDGSASPRNNTTGGELRINLGEISEDVMRNNKYEFENGLPPDGGNANTATTVWGKVTTRQWLNNFFNNSATARANQDVGLDGLKSTEELTQFSTQLGLNQAAKFTPDALKRLQDDPAADNFISPLAPAYDARQATVVERYKNFNGVEGNTPLQAGGTTIVGSSDPDKEDLNNDHQINTVEAYREYRVSLKKGQLKVGQQFIVDQITDASGEATWYQFRIPINTPAAIDHGSFSTESVRFMRLYLTGWSQPVVLRMARLRLVSSQWRKSTQNLAAKGLKEVKESNTANFEISVVNIEENSTPAGGKPPYLLPPGITRDNDNSASFVRRANEQSLKISVESLEDGNAVAGYKQVKQDLVNYKRIKMYFHAEQNGNHPIQDNEAAAFLRLGLDQTKNYYEIEVPLKITPDNRAPYTPQDVWPSANEINLAFNELYALKSARNAAKANVLSAYSRKSIDQKYKLTVVGNPKLNNVTTLMIGIRNLETPGDNSSKSVSIWANEIRVTDYDETKGWAANARLSLKLADFATINASTRYTGVGFGGIQDNISQRTRDESLAYNTSMNMNIDKLIPWKTGIKIPMYVSYAKSTSTPKFDPLDPDIPLAASVLKFDQLSEQQAYKDKVITQSVNKGINFVNVRKEKVKKDAKKHLYDIENFAFSYAYSEQTSSNATTAQNISKRYNGSIAYNFNTQSKPIEPFKKTKIFDSPYLQLIKDLNFSPLPNSLSVRWAMDRAFQKKQLRNADLTTTGIAPNYIKSFRFDRTYALRWNIFRSLNLSYNATTNAVIDEPNGEIDTQAKQDSIWSNILQFGRVRRFHQALSATYKLPLGKLPLTDWLSADYKHAVAYNWQAGNVKQVHQFGNTINNTRTRDLTGRVNLKKLYDKSKYLKEVNASKPPTPQINQEGDTLSHQSAAAASVGGLVRLLMSVRGLSFTYSIRESTNLTGFLPAPYLFGLSQDFSAPGAGFIFGSQDPTLRFRAAENRWLVQNPSLTTPFTQTLSDNLSIQSTVEPFRDLKIQLSLKRNEQNRYQEIFRYDDQQSSAAGQPTYRSFTPSRSGSYTISFLPILTSFDPNTGENVSAVFERFVANRSLIQQRLNLINPSPIEYGVNSQDVIIPAFIAAYTATDPSSVALTPFPRIPLPNWRINYAGLSKIPFLKEIFSSVNLTHAYTSTFSITNYTSSLKYKDTQLLDLRNSILDYPLASQAGQNGTLTPVYIISQVKMTEQFSPFIGLSLRTKSKLTATIQYNRQRTLSLNITNSQVAETKSSNFSLDLGIIATKMKLPFRMQGRTITLKNDLQFRTTFAIRDTQTIQRKIENVQTITSGNLSYQLRPTLTYLINQKINLTMYYEYNSHRPMVTGSYNRSNSSFGVQVRFSLTQ